MKLGHQHIGRLSYCNQPPVASVCLNVSTTPITTMGYQQCLPLSVLQLEGYLCRNGVEDTFGQRLPLAGCNSLTYLSVDVLVSLEFFLY